MHCCCACLRMSRFPFPCCTGDGKRSRAVDVIYFRAKPIVKGGLGGNRSGFRLMGFNFRDFFVFFLVRLQINFLCILGAIWGAFGALLASILGVPGNSEN